MSLLTILFCITLFCIGARAGQGLGYGASNLLAPISSTAQGRQGQGQQGTTSYFATIYATTLEADDSGATHALSIFATIDSVGMTLEACAVYCAGYYFFEPVVFPLFEELELEYIFIEDGSKVYAGSSRLPRLEHGIRGFHWPPSSPDLNPIEKGVAKALGSGGRGVMATTLTNTASATTQTDCSTVCAGNPYEYCGGPLASELYELTGNNFGFNVGNYAYVGYTDAAAPLRTLNGSSVAYNLMAYQYCETFCAKTGFSDLKILMNVTAGILSSQLEWWLPKITVLERAPGTHQLIVVHSFVDEHIGLFLAEHVFHCPPS
ncbi:hypothetical protein G7Y89_g6436 [Cudoniella acicularis]|uniref:Uncharacterized protein n=1 Tax=Cudoniella acicularis TaxID=354080 RepID=A0A8H4RLB6_9HELO|nr:hypothetical protein G7Y89_g6436 [Cudoniella acicularis]